MRSLRLEEQRSLRTDEHGSLQGAATSSLDIEAVFFVQRKVEGHLHETQLVLIGVDDPLRRGDLHLTIQGAQKVSVDDAKFRRCRAGHRF